jgi:hypothetical protein
LCIRAKYRRRRHLNRMEESVGGPFAACGSPWLQRSLVWLVRSGQVSPPFALDVGVRARWFTVPAGRSERAGPCGLSAVLCGLCIRSQYRRRRRLNRLVEACHGVRAGRAVPKPSQFRVCAHRPCTLFVHRLAVLAPSTRQHHQDALARTWCATVDDERAHRACLTRPKRNTAVFAGSRRPTPIRPPLRTVSVSCSTRW